MTKTPLILSGNLTRLLALNKRTGWRSLTVVIIMNESACHLEAFERRLTTNDSKIIWAESNDACLWPHLHNIALPLTEWLRASTQTDAKVTLHKLPRVKVATYLLCNRFKKCQFSIYIKCEAPFNKTVSNYAKLVA